MVFSFVQSVVTGLPPVNSFSVDLAKAQESSKFYHHLGDYLISAGYFPV